VIKPPSPGVYAEARRRLDALAKPVGALGRLEDLAAWIAACQAACPPRPLDQGRAVILAGDHGVSADGVSAYPPEVTAQMVANFVAGGAAATVLARAQGVRVRVVDVSVDVDWAASGLPIQAEVTDHRIRRVTFLKPLPASMYGITPAGVGITIHGGTRIVGIKPTAAALETSRRLRVDVDVAGDFSPYVIELPEHPWFVAVQYHPEFKSKPTKAHPLFREFVHAARDRRPRDAAPATHIHRRLRHPRDRPHRGAG